MKILVCTDSSAQSLKAAKEAIRIAKGCGAAQVDVIHVFNVDLHFHDIHHTISQVEHYEIMQQIRKKEGERILEETAKVFTDAGIAVKTILKEGHPAGTIIKHAKKEEYDLIVMGSRGLGGLKKALLGSVSNAVLQEVQTSVLVVK
ncbi:MAG: universal stress protein [Firmicutes bacterium]|nr:universal stress protein [Bacillota bacterium]